MCSEEVYPTTLGSTQAGQPTVGEFGRVYEAALGTLLELKASCHESLAMLPEYKARSIAYDIARRAFGACRQVQT